MKSLITKKCKSFFLEEVKAQTITFEKEDYEIRINALLSRMKELGKTHIVIYGDREHFANIHYFSGYDCRFEEALLIFDQQGKVSIVVGNEGISQTYQIPYDIDVYLYQNFSLQGQPRNKQDSLSNILSKIGVTSESILGLVGYKYFENTDIDTDPLLTFDVPMYIVQVLQRVCGCNHLTNFTKEITGFPNGIRMTIRTAKEIAWAEAAGNKVSSTMLRMLKRLKPGLSEIEVGEGVSDMDALNVFPMINFGEKSVAIGVKSPSEQQLQLGEVCGLAYSTRGNLTARVGIAAYDRNTVSDKLKPHLAFYEQLWLVIAHLLETMQVGTSCAQMHTDAMALIGDEKYGMSLNITHYTGADEWTNSPVYDKSPYRIGDGAHIQVDVIASNPDPVRTAICEDSVVIAGKSLREALYKEYPNVYERIVARQNMIRTELGINIHDDCLPMSNMTGVYFPYMLNLNEIFALNS